MPPDFRRTLWQGLRLAHDVHHLPIYPLWVAGIQWINCIPLGWGGTQYIDARGGESQ